jgi:hypothetical protein
MYISGIELVVFLAAGIWSVSWSVVPLAKLTDPHLRRDLATTPQNPTAFLEAKLWMPAIIAAAPSAMLALYAAITFSMRAYEAPVAALDPIARTIGYILPWVMPYLILVASGWFLLLRSTRIAMRKNRRLNIWAAGICTWVVTAAAALGWWTMIDHLLGDSVRGAPAPRLLPMFLLCLTISIAAIRIVCGQWGRLKDEFLNLDPDATH